MKVLALDGGGIRGIIPAMVLAHVEEQTGRATAELFDVIAGTSTGGILALGLPFASPTGYGLGKAGWVTARFGKGEKAPVDLLRSWIDESYRAVAPKKLVAALSAAPAAGQVSARGRTSAPRRSRRARKVR